jgi:isoamylase
MTPPTAAPSAASRAPALPGSRFPLGATARDGGTNFAVEAAAADSMMVCLFDSGGAETQIPLLDYDAGVWHGFVPGAGAGQAYGYRAAGRYDPGSGLRFNPAKLLLDPYARAITGAVRFGPEVLGYPVGGDPDAPSTLDSAAQVPRSLVVHDEYRWSDGARPWHPYADIARSNKPIAGTSSNPNPAPWNGPPPAGRKYRVSRT